MDRGRETERRPAGAAAGRLPARAGRASALPVSLPPRGLNRIQAAEYVGVSPTLFDRMVLDGLMPRPFRVYARVIWGRFELDAAFAALPNDGEEGRADDVWGKCAA